MTKELKELLPEVVIASSNNGKINEFKVLLEDLPCSIVAQPKALDVEETGSTFIENARIKALAAAKLTGQFALADDSGLCVEALQGAPGVHSARYAISDKARITRLLDEMSDCTNRSAIFVACLCFASPQHGVLLEVYGKCKGVITYSPRGINGFGYDPVFELPEISKTFAEMTKSQKQKIGHRGKAFSLIKPTLEELLYSFG
tara:strand:+ start:2257 stop:2865 length:609 start_codon:yes stop_codon:yes gene_type:complete